MSQKTHEELMLGDSVDTILDAAQQMEPRISEYQFQREVLDILEFPFGKEALLRYSLYVGELTKPLHVVEDNNRDVILFSVPALVQSPTTTLLQKDGITVNGYINTLQREADLGGGMTVHKKLQDFMMTITQAPNYYNTVVVPIQQILSRYGRTMGELPGVSNTAVPQQGGQRSGNSFSEEYDD